MEEAWLSRLEALTPLMVTPASAAEVPDMPLV
jgi:hypothetical protein